MKRFLVFGGSRYYASGGWEDFVSDHDTLAECKHPVDPWGDKVDWYHVVDTETQTIVKSNSEAFT